MGWKDDNLDVPWGRFVTNCTKVLLSALSKGKEVLIRSGGRQKGGETLQLLFVFPK
jgi:hypothetical protein